MLQSYQYRSDHWIILGIVFMIVVFPISSFGQYYYNADETTAKAWMKLEKDKRAFFIMGFLAGADHVHKSKGMAMSFSDNLSVYELSSQVYKELLSYPELREGPIGMIIDTVLDFHIFNIGGNPRTVAPAESDLKTIEHSSPLP